MADQPNDNLAELRPYQQLDSMPKRTIFVRDLELDAFIGAYESEMGQAQPVIVNIELQVTEPANPVSDNLEDVVCYNRLTRGIEDIIAEGHIRLVETLAERIAAMCLAHPMALAVRVSVDKPNAIARAAGAGVEIIRHKKV